jgi:dihydropyrimidinase
MMYDLVIRGGTVMLPGADGVLADVAVKDGKIAAIGAPGQLGDAKETLDAKGLHVMPGIIDVHLHLGHGKDIARPRVKEDAAVETAAAVTGGITTFIPYLMSPVPFEDMFDEVKQVTESGSRIDFGYHFIIATDEQLAAVPRYVAEYGVPSFKIFMNLRGGEGKRLGLPDVDDGFLLKLLEQAAATGAVVCPHPENIEASWVLRDRLMAEDPDGKGGLAAWNDSRPPFVEADAVQRIGLFARHTGARIHIVHVSSEEALIAALDARDAGTDISIETCPHYLTHDVTWEGGDRGKINPPLREMSDCDALWGGVLSGDIDLIATDHVHRDLTGKEGGIWKASPGCPGLESLLPVTLSEGADKRGLPLQNVVSLLCEKPADIMGLDSKGRIAIGKDADFAIVDLGKEHTATRESVVSSAGYSIYEGWPMQGTVAHTIVRGRFALRDGKLQDDAIGTGLYVKRNARP